MNAILRRLQTKSVLIAKHTRALTEDITDFANALADILLFDGISHWNLDITIKPSTQAELILTFCSNVKDALDAEFLQLTNVFLGGEFGTEE